MKVYSVMIFRFFFLVILAAGLPLNLASAQKYRDAKFNAVELAQMPKYCYAQYVDEKLSADPQYSIQGCGAYMNHYCPGLLQMMRAQKPSSPGHERKENIRQAKGNFDYTLKFMPQGCWLRPEAEAAAARARVLDASIR